MTSEERKGMNTNFVGHHVSAGGYIFFHDKTNNKTYVVLIRNKKGEWWIPKGHIEEWENEKEAALREIEEEVGINKDNLNYIDFLENYSFDFLDGNKMKNTKEIHIYVFEAEHKLPITTKNGGGDVVAAEWFETEYALEKIMSYSRKQLENALKIFETYKHERGL